MIIDYQISIAFLLGKLTHVLPEESTTSILDLLSFGEVILAHEYLCDHLLEVNSKIDDVYVKEIYSIGRELGIDPKMYAFIDKLNKGG